MTDPAPPLVLASGSATRARMLADAGLTFETVPAGVDEATARESMDAEGANASEMAVALARLKAERVSQRKPGALVIGADQILALEDRRFDKPTDRASARECLVALRGRATHARYGGLRYPRQRHDLARQRDGAADHARFQR